jgi:cation/acetate symporter
MFGTAGLPNILTRFYTVPNAKEARKSVFYATGFIGYFYVLTFIIGFGAAVLVGRDVIASTDGGGNMAALLLAEALAGNLFLGFLAAVAFTTILAVVVGLTLTGASMLSSDIYVGVIRRGRSAERQEVLVSNVSIIALGLTGILLGILFKGQNVAFLVGLAFAVAASANFPALLMSLFWKKFTTQGAVASIMTGLLLAVVFIIFGPTVWVEVLGNASPIFPLKNPGLFSMGAAFLAGITVSLMTSEVAAEEKFDAQRVKTALGMGAEHFKTRRIRR